MPDLERSGCPGNIRNAPYSALTQNTAQGLLVWGTAVVGPQISPLLVALGATKVVGHF